MNLAPTINRLNHSSFSLQKMKQNKVKKRLNFRELFPSRKYYLDVLVNKKNVLDSVSPDKISKDSSSVAPAPAAAPDSAAAGTARLLLLLLSFLLVVVSLFVGSVAAAEVLLSRLPLGVSLAVVAGRFLALSSWLSRASLNSSSRSSSESSYERF